MGMLLPWRISTQLAMWKAVWLNSLINAPVPRRDSPPKWHLLAASKISLSSLWVKNGLIGCPGFGDTIGSISLTLLGRKQFTLISTWCLDANNPHGDRWHWPCRKVTWSKMCGQTKYGSRTVQCHLCKTKTGGLTWHSTCWALPTLTERGWIKYCQQKGKDTGLFFFSTSSMKRTSGVDGRNW